MAFAKNVFINCPFDADYTVLLRPLIFTVIFLDFEPRLSQTKSSSQIRINQIKQHIRESKYGIHDLSRCRPLKFSDELHVKLIAQSYTTPDINEMPIADYIKFAKDWVKELRA